MKDAEADARRRRAFDDMLGKAERLNGRGQYADALSILVEGIREYGENEDVLSYVFETVLAWRKSYIALCYARHYITYLLARKNHKKALKVCEACFEFALEFVLANAMDVIPLAKMTEKQGRHALAHSLVQEAETRYGDGLDVSTAGLMEVRLLAGHLEYPRAGGMIVKTVG